MSSSVRWKAEDDKGRNTTMMYRQPNSNPRSYLLANSDKSSLKNKAPAPLQLTKSKAVLNFSRSPTRSPTTTPTTSPPVSPTQVPDPPFFIQQLNKSSSTKSPPSVRSPTQSPTRSPPVSPTRSPTVSPTRSPAHSPRTKRKSQTTSPRSTTDLNEATTEESNKDENVVELEVSTGN
eukprot:TRINITY_DN773_c0_g1_i10.p2 TRINITY_DN773_c0_g1~~TRINITY_DN773_c0_g1_i10.p2  ORF type:complete len:177 (-),score=47.70 TRINITY_DN773_c0_g1_i10:103-633(-)